MTSKALLTTSRVFRFGSIPVFGGLYFLAFQRHSDWPIFAAIIGPYLALQFIGFRLAVGAFKLGASGLGSLGAFTLDDKGNPVSGKDADRYARFKFAEYRRSRRESAERG